MLKVIAAIVPSAGLLFLFWLALRALIDADRRERAAEAKLTGRQRPAVRPGAGSAAGSAAEAGAEAPAAPGPVAPTPEAGSASTAAEGRDSDHAVEVDREGDGA